MTTRIADISEPHTPTIKDEFHREVIELMCRYIRDHLDGDLTVNTLAARSGYSRWHFSYIFRQVMGMSAARYVTATRLDRAAELLRDTDLTIDKIVHAVGYRSVGSFPEPFAARFGLVPSRYRHVARAAARSERPAAQEELQE